MNRPRISCNLAISADGKISSVGHRPSNWTSDADLRRLKELRRGKDALMVGRGTAETDRMTMTIESDGPQPLRCIVSRHGELSTDHPVYSRPGGQIHLLATDGHRGKAGGPATVHECSLVEFLETLSLHHGVKRLHCEGGGQLIRALAELDFLDDIHLTLAGHTLLGGARSPTLVGTLGEFLPASRAFQLRHCEASGATGECFLTYERGAQ